MKIREGARHTIWAAPSDRRRRAPVPRHREIDRILVRAICRQLGIAEPGRYWRAARGSGSDRRSCPERGSRWQARTRLGHVDGTTTLLDVAEKLSRPATDRRNDPLTIRLPVALRARAERYARSRAMPLAGALRTLIGEHLDEIAEDEHLTRAQRWQRDQAWASARSIAGGAARPVSWDRLRRDHASAVARLRRRREAS